MCFCPRLLVTVALSATLLNCPVRGNVALMAESTMTGRLRGVNGLRLKLAALADHAIKERWPQAVAVISSENVYNGHLQDMNGEPIHLPKVQRDRLRIIPVETSLDALKLVFAANPPGESYM